MQNTIPKKSEPVLQKFLVGFMFVAMIAAIIFGLIWIKAIRDYSAGNAAYRRLQGFSPDTAAIESSLAQTDASLPQSEAAPVVSASQTELRASRMDFSGLKAVNEDVVGWLSAEAVGINYPVVLGTDNAYYLDHLVTHEPSRLGSLFADYRNQGDFSDRNTVIYGHNMQDGSMFAGLMEYKKQEVYEQPPTLLLFTPDGDYRIELFAGVITDGRQDFGRQDFSTTFDFLAYIDNLRDQSTFQSDVRIKEEDRIITLSTCTYEFEEGRFVVFGKLIPLG